MLIFYNYGTRLIACLFYSPSTFPIENLYCEYIFGSETKMSIHCRDIRLEDTYFSKDVERAVMAASKALYKEKTLPTLLLANQVGNMYTPSVYGGLTSYIAGYVVI